MGPGERNNTAWRASLHEMRVLKVEEKKTSTKSATQLSEAELHDLVAFLLSVEEEKSRVRDLERME